MFVARQWLTRPLSKILSTSVQNHLSEIAFQNYMLLLDIWQNCHIKLSQNLQLCGCFWQLLTKPQSKIIFLAYEHMNYFIYTKYFKLLLPFCPMHIWVLQLAYLYNLYIYNIYLLFNHCLRNFLSPWSNWSTGDIRIYQSVCLSVCPLFRPTYIINYLKVQYV